MVEWIVAGETSGADEVLSLMGVFCSNGDPDPFFLVFFFFLATSVGCSKVARVAECII